MLMAVLGSVFLLKPGAMLMLMGIAAAKCHVDVSDYTATWNRVGVCGPTAIWSHVQVCGPTATWSHVGVCGLSYHLRPGGCPWSALQPEVMLMSLGWAPPRAMMVFHGLCFSRGSYWCLWSVLPLEEAMLRSIALYGCWRPWVCLWSVLSPETM